VYPRDLASLRSVFLFTRVYLEKFAEKAATANREFVGILMSSLRVRQFGRARVLASHLLVSISGKHFARAIDRYVTFEIAGCVHLFSRDPSSVPHCVARSRETELLATRSRCHANFFARCSSNSHESLTGDDDSRENKGCRVVAQMSSPGSRLHALSHKV